MRTSIYIDGFNLYYLAVRGTRYKWLDLKAVCQKLLPAACKIEVIKYFTARVSGKFDPDQPMRQSTYIRALESHIRSSRFTMGISLRTQKVRRS